MKFSESWLREWVNPPVDTTELVSQLTMAGLEVDGVEPVAPPFSGVVVGEIVSVEQHPDADKLRVCQVAGNSDVPLQVVCGAPNARIGIKIPFATVGAVLPGDLKIGKAKPRGVESFGMLCAEQELGVSDASDGLWELPAEAPVGENLRDYLSLDDKIIEVDLTPNRGDCLSVRGVAREVGVLNRTAVTEPRIAPVKPVVEETFPVTLSAPQACPRYVGRVIKGIDPRATSPLWLQDKLRRCGLRSIDPVVDVTNYILMELGQPMHAFDLGKLQGGIDVRMANAGEKLTLLGGAETELDAETLVITDQSQAVAMAGIMGGAETAVSDVTTSIFLESAYFDRVVIANKARGYGLHTDSSHRFERGVDPKLQKAAIERATELLLDIVGGEPGPVVCVESAEQLAEPLAVPLASGNLAQQLGVVIPAEQVDDILNRLGMAIVARQDAGDSVNWTVQPPSWRFDIAIEADLVEEIARIYGYNNIPTTTVTAGLAIKASPENRRPLSVIRDKLLAHGFQEVITYSFVAPEVQQLVTPGQDSVALANPIASDMAVMRMSLWPGLMAILRNNLNRQQSRVRAFEVGQVFVPDTEGLVQENRIAGVICGDAQPENWASATGEVDFFDLKGVVEMLLGDVSQYQFATTSHPMLQPGQAARVAISGEVVGLLGKLHPAVAGQLDIAQEAFVFELDLAQIQQTAVPSYRDISKFPEVRRDLAFIVDREVSFSALEKVAREAAGKNLTHLKVFDVYQGKGIENNRKSIALGLTFQDSSRTLAEEEINTAAGNVVDALEQKFAASLRG